MLENAPGGGAPGVWISGDTLHALARKRKPFLDGKRLLSNQTFRDIYRTDTLESTQRLKITSLTFLFTDLKGSTELYERVGDLVASISCAPFPRAARHRRREPGPWSRPSATRSWPRFRRPIGVAAALRMREAMLGSMRAPARRPAAQDRIHEGPCLAVTLNDRKLFRPDGEYRVPGQGLAVTRSIFATTWWSMTGRPRAAGIPGVSPLPQRRALRDRQRGDAYEISVTDPAAALAGCIVRPPSIVAGGDGLRMSAGRSARDWPATGRCWTTASGAARAVRRRPGKSARFVLSHPRSGDPGRGGLGRRLADSATTRRQRQALLGGAAAGRPEFNRAIKRRPHRSSPCPTIVPSASMSRAPGGRSTACAGLPRPSWPCRAGGLRRAVARTRQPGLASPCGDVSRRRWSRRWGSGSRWSRAASRCPTRCSRQPGGELAFRGINWRLHDSAAGYAAALAHPRDPVRESLTTNLSCRASATGPSLMVAKRFDIVSRFLDARAQAACGNSRRMRPA